MPELQTVAWPGIPQCWSLPQVIAQVLLFLSSRFPHLCYSLISLRRFFHFPDQFSPLATTKPLSAALLNADSKYPTFYWKAVPGWTSGNYFFANTAHLLCSCHRDSATHQGSKLKSGLHSILFLSYIHTAHSLFFSFPPFIFPFSHTAIQLTFQAFTRVCCVTLCLLGC